MTLGERIRQLRGKVTLNVLSLQTGLSIAYLSDISRDRTAPSVKTLVILANHFRMSVSALLAPVTLSGELYPSSMPEPLPYDDIPVESEDWMRENKVGPQYDPSYWYTPDILIDNPDDDSGYDDPRYGGY